MFPEIFAHLDVEAEWRIIRRLYIRKSSIYLGRRITRRDLISEIATPHYARAHTRIVYIHMRVRSVHRALIRRGARDQRDL